MYRLCNIKPQKSFDLSILDKNNKIKKKMKTIGKVEIPGDAFLTILKTDK